jgi:hypothetical protein
MARNNQGTRLDVGTRNSAQAAFPYGAPATAKSAEVSKDPKKMTRERLNPSKAANPFESNMRKCKTVFSQSYVAGSIPCRLHSTAIKFQLQWEDCAKQGFSPDLLVVCADGLAEEEHPYTIMAIMMYEELVGRAEGCVELFLPVLDTLVAHIRKALLLDHAAGRALNALHLLVASTANQLMPYVAKLVPALSKHFRDKRHKDVVVQIFGLLEQQCGPDASKIIKAKIPTY